MNRARSITPFAQSLYAVLSAIVRLGMRNPLSHFEISGLENIPPHGKVIVACNHPSRLNSFTIWAISRRNPAVLIVSTMFHIPVIGLIFRVLGNIPIYRDVRIAGRKVVNNAGRRRAAVRSALVVLEQGGMVEGYFEGKLSTKGVIHPFFRGVGILSYNANSPVVPIGILIGRSGLRFTTRIRIGEPIYPFYFTEYDDPAASITAAVRRSVSRLSGLPLEEDVSRSDDMT